MKLLIVDDSPLLQSRLEKALRLMDGQICITAAFSYDEAIEMFYKFIPDIVLLDIALPGGSGIDLLKQFKEARPEVPVVMMTNYPNSGFKEKCMELGTESFFDKSSLSRIIKHVLSLGKSNSVV